jgi:chaperonin GroEL (HSP60 family)
MQVDRGSQIAAGIKSLNPLEQLGIDEIRIAASTVYDNAGDCSKLTAILSAGLMTRGQELIEKDFHPRDIVETLKNSVENVAKHVARNIRPADARTLAAVATTAASGDARVGGLVVEALKRAGRNGIVTIETGDTASTTLEVVEGTVFDRGWLSEYFVTIAGTALEREKLQERLAKLVGSLAVLKAGGLSEAEIVGERYRLESAMHSTRSAIEHGWVVGGGMALLRAGLAAKRSETGEGLAEQAAKALASVLEEPVIQLVESAGKSSSEVLAELLKSNSQDWGFDAKRCEVGDLVRLGVLDAAKLLEMSLRTAMSQAASVLQTGTWGLDIPPVSRHKPEQ